MEVPRTALQLEPQPVVLEDVPALVEIFYEAFKDDIMTHIFPDTPGLRDWWAKIYTNSLLNKPDQHFFKIVDPKAKDARGRPQIAAFSKWDLAKPETGERHLSHWHEDIPVEEADAFFKKMQSERQRIMGDQRHYYVSALATRPEYQRQGAGFALIKWGCDLADKDGVCLYVDSSTEGAPLYQKFGFVDKSEPDAVDAVSMVRSCQ